MKQNNHFSFKEKASTNRIILSFLLIFSTLFYFSCNNKEQTFQKNENANDDGIQITATFYPLYIMALNVTKDVSNVNVQMMAPKATGCLHDYQLTVNDMQLLQDSDIIIANGAGMESFLEKVLDTKKDSVIILTEGITLIDESEEHDSHEASETHEVGEHHDEEEIGEHHEHGEKNPHVWVSVSGAIQEVKNLADGLERLDKDNKEIYEKNAEEYIQKLSNLDSQMKEALLQYKGQEIITFHEAFPYFAQEFGFKIIGTLISEEGSEPSPREVSDIINMIKEKQTAGKNVLLFTEPQYEARLANTIANETGIQIYSLDPCVTGDSSIDSYIVAMKKNLQTLITACSESVSQNNGKARVNNSL